MQLVEGRTYQALELSRLANIPEYLTGAPAGTGMTYLNAEQAKADLIDFGAAPLIACIEQTLSGPNVTPNSAMTAMPRIRTSAVMYWSSGLVGGLELTQSSSSPR